MRLTSFYLVSSLGSIIQASSGWWDVFSHRIEFVDEDPFLNPAHVGLYTGTALLAACVFKSVPRVAGIRLLRASVALQLLAGASNEVVHKIPSLEKLLDFYVHSIFTVGMLTFSLILFINLSLHISTLRRPGYALMLPQAVSGAALWLFSSGPVLYLFHEYSGVVELILGFVASAITCTALSSCRRPGIASLTALLYSTPIYLLLTLYVGVGYYIPLGVFAVLLAEAVILSLASLGHEKIALLTGGALQGLLVKQVYHPMLDWLVTSFPSAVGAAGGAAAALTILTAGEKIAARYIAASPSLRYAD